MLAGAATLVASAALVLAVATRASGYAEGAPAGFSGGFSEQSCHACHFDAEPDSGPGRVVIEGLPERFAPGRRYRLTITLTRAGMKRGGFQLTARFREGGTQAGSLAPAEGDETRVRLDVQGGIEYLGQRREGAAPVAAGRAAWRLLWTAPASTHAVVFHVAANAANGDDTAEGDYVHSLAVERAPEAPGPR